MKGHLQLTLLVILGWVVGFFFKNKKSESQKRDSPY